MTPHWAFLSIGSNLGEPMHNCCRALSLLSTDDRVQVADRSPFYWTAPVDYTDQQWFLNAALKIHTALNPLGLLDMLLEIQHTMGRKGGGIRFGPRILDLDIILYEDLILKTSQLTIPHPRMHKRRFVLQPICDIEPEVRHPILGLRADELLNQLDKDDQEIRPCSYDC